VVITVVRMAVSGARRAASFHLTQCYHTYLQTLLGGACGDTRVNSSDLL
jgi:hypothetical protein